MKAIFISLLSIIVCISCVSAPATYNPTESDPSDLAKVEIAPREKNTINMAVTGIYNNDEELILSFSNVASTTETFYLEPSIYRIEARCDGLSGAGTFTARPKAKLELKAGERYSVKCVHLPNTRNKVILLVSESKE